MFESRLHQDERPQRSVQGSWAGVTAAAKDAMETFQKSFCCFLLEIPTDFCGVQAISVATAGTATTLRLSEKGSERTFEVQHAVMKHVPVHMVFECCTLFRDDLESPL